MEETEDKKQRSDTQNVMMLQFGLDLVPLTPRVGASGQRLSRHSPNECSPESGARREVLSVRAP